MLHLKSNEYKVKKLRIKHFPDFNPSLCIVVTASTQNAKHEVLSYKTMCHSDKSRASQSHLNRIFNSVRALGAVKTQFHPS